MRRIARAVLGLLCLAGPSAAQVEVMARSGQRVSGSHLRVRSVEAPYVGSHGEGAFIAFLDVGRALMIWRDGELRLAARDAAAAPGLPAGTVFAGVTLLGFDDAGLVYIASDAHSPVTGKFYSGVWSYDSEARRRRLVVAAPKSYPGVGKLDFLYSPSLGSAGHVAFVDGLERLLLHAPDGSVEIVAALGDPAPGAPGSVFLDFVPPFRVDGSGAVAFDAVLELSPGNGTSGSGVWRRAPDGSLSLVAMDGGPVPGAAPGSQFLAVASRDANASGSLFLKATLAIGTGDVTPGNDRCVLGPGAAAAETIVARRGDPAPGLAGAVFEDFDPHASIDDAGRALVPGVLEIGPGGIGPDDTTGLWLSDGAGNLDLLLHQGAAMPGNPGLALLAAYDVVQGKSGDIGIGGAIGPPGSVDTSQSGLIGVPLGGDPVVLIQDGDTLELAPGVPSQPGTYQLADSYPDRPGLRAVDAGSVAFFAFFDDGATAAVMATLPVPEPGQVLQILCGGLVLALVGRRQGPRAPRP